MKNIFVYQKPGLFHIGSSYMDWKKEAAEVVALLKDAKVNAFYDDNIKYEVWKKLMLNVAGNAITALTGIDYCMFEKSPEVQELCVRVMKEFASVAKTIGVELGENEINEIMDYYLSFKVSKKTSMLEDVINKRKTENSYIAGHISRLAKEHMISVPYIDSLFLLMKIKEDVYLGKV